MHRLIITFSGNSLNWKIPGGSYRLILDKGSYFTRIFFSRSYPRLLLPCTSAPLRIIYITEGEMLLLNTLYGILEVFRLVRIQYLDNFNNFITGSYEIISNEFWIRNIGPASRNMEVFTTYGTAVYAFWVFRCIYWSCGVSRSNSFVHVRAKQKWVKKWMFWKFEQIVSDRRRCKPIRWWVKHKEAKKVYHIIQGNYLIRSSGNWTWWLVT